MNRLLCTLLMFPPLALGGCTTFDVDAPTDLPPQRPAAERPTLSIEAREAVLESPEDYQRGGELGELRPTADPARYLEAFERTAQFRTVARDADIHCKLLFGSHHIGETASAFLSGITLTVLPGVTGGSGILRATVSAPDRDPVVYEFRSEYSLWVWLPLLPIGLVQGIENGFGQPDTLPHLIRALVHRMAEDGWLDAARSHADGA